MPTPIPNALDLSIAAMDSENIMGSTTMPIICLMEWDSPKCREQAFELPPPKFAPNYRKFQEKQRNAAAALKYNAKIKHGKSKSDSGLGQTGKNQRSYSSGDRMGIDAQYTPSDHPMSFEKHNNGFFTPVLPKAFHQHTSAIQPTRPPVQISASVSSADVRLREKLVSNGNDRAASSRSLIPDVPKETSSATQPPVATTASTTIRQRPRTQPVYDSTLYAVRPTTPMNEIMSTTPKAVEVSAQVPRTALVGLASLGVVVVVAFILIFVFCKRSSSKSDSTYYPMVCAGNGKPVTSGGYTAIPPSSTEASPQFTQHHQIQSFDHGGATFGTKVNSTGQVGAKTTTSLLPTSMRNGHGGYQALKSGTLPPGGVGNVANGSATLPNNLVNGRTALEGMQRHTTTSLVNGQVGSARSDQQEGAKKKEFKEWYV